MESKFVEYLKVSANNLREALSIWNLKYTELTNKINEIVDTPLPQRQKEVISAA